jgi:hypothetical protein
MIYRRFLIRENDHFVPYQFQQVDAEIDNIHAELAHIPLNGKAEMLISYCKYGSIQSEQSRTNPELAKRVETLAVTGIAELFECCANNLSFTEELEEHLKERLNVPVR